MHSAVSNVSSFIPFPRCKANDEECEMTFTEVATQVGCSGVAADQLLWALAFPSWITFIFSMTLNATLIWPHSLSPMRFLVVQGRPGVDLVPLRTVDELLALYKVDYVDILKVGGSGGA